jgi:asparagine synthase (glutamine-hydrolysing)
LFDLALGFRRLSILDLTPSGHHPMSSRDGRLWIVFNGEVYNYLELGEELAKLGHRFTSTSDTEVLLAGYKQWGMKMLPRLVGMFAFAILDLEERKLVLVRDFFGIKPLYYALNERRFAFASEAKALIALGDVSRKVDPDALYMYLRHGLTDNGEATLWSEIRHVPAAHFVEIPLDSPSPAVKPTRYWQINLAGRTSMPPSAAAEKLRALFLENIRLHLRSDVPVGAALSGGIDSSAIVAAMRYHQPQGVIHTFSYIADEPRMDEERWVDLVSQAAGTTAHKTPIAAADLMADLDDFLFQLDEPFSNTTMYAQFRVFRLAHRAGIKVMLDGQGADESLGGYNYFLSARLASMWRRRRWTEAFAFVRSNWNRTYFGGPRLIFRAGSWLLPEAYHGAARRLIGDELMPDWLNRTWFERRGVRPTPLFAVARDEDLFLTVVARSITTTSLPMLLRYEDRNSMAHSVESRVPFLTPNLVDFIVSLPEGHIVDIEGNTKSIFRRAMRGLVPSEVLERRDKVGFSTPELRWLNELRPWVEQVLGSEMAEAIPALNRAKLLDQWHGIAAGWKPFSFQLWRWINLIHWANRHQIEF